MEQAGTSKNYPKYIEMANKLPYVTQTIAESGVDCAESITMAFNFACFILHATYQDDIKEWTAQLKLIAF